MHFKILFLLHLLPLSAISQNMSMRIGKYQDRDLHVVNPPVIVEKDTVWTAQEVYVNDSLVLSGSQLHKYIFVIPLTGMHFNTGDPIRIKFIQAATETMLKILDP